MDQRYNQGTTGTKDVNGHLLIDAAKWLLRRRGLCISLPVATDMRHHLPSPSQSMQRQQRCALVPSLPIKQEMGCFPYALALQFPLLHGSAFAIFRCYAFFSALDKCPEKPWIYSPLSFDTVHGEFPLIQS